MKEEKKNINLELGFTVFSDDGKELSFPPLANAKYPVSISERALKEYIARGGAIIEVPAENGKKPLQMADKRTKKETAGQEK